MSATFNPEIIEIRRRLDDQTREIAELRGNMQQIDKLVTLANRQSTLQIAAIVITLCLTIAGGLYFQTNSINQRISPLEKRMDRLEQRMDRMEQILEEIRRELRARK